MSTGSPMLACAAPRIRAACRTAEMMMAITNAIRPTKSPTVATSGRDLDRRPEDLLGLGLRREHHAR